MSFLLFVTIFWIFAAIAILLRAIPRFQVKTPILATIKAIPGVSAVVAVLLFQPYPIIFYALLAIAVFFCACGDFALEFSLIAGLGLFLFAHIFFVVNFVWQSLVMGLYLDMTVPLAAFALCFFAMLVYVFYYHKYLKTSETEIPKVMLNAVAFYAIVISLTLSTSLLYWLAIGWESGGWVFIGALLFVISDSLIGVRDFHHEFARQEIRELAILLTYYMAIFLITVGTFQVIHAAYLPLPEFLI
ncbi:MAG: lysoplasmalogenase family protein [Promethearchaeota archaeon]